MDTSFNRDGWLMRIIEFEWGTFPIFVNQMNRAGGVRHKHGCSGKALKFTKNRNASFEEVIRRDKVIQRDEINRRRSQ
jgi:hypothetical protein